MRVKNMSQYELLKQENLHSIYLTTMEKAENWANQMEGYIDKGYKVTEVASECSIGLSTQEYVWARDILEEHWEYGEELKQWECVGFVPIKKDGGESS